MCLPGDSKPSQVEQRERQSPQCLSVIFLAPASEPHDPILPQEADQGMWGTNANKQTKLP